MDQQEEKPTPKIHPLSILLLMFSILLLITSIYIVQSKTSARTKKSVPTPTYRTYVENEDTSVRKSVLGTSSAVIIGEPTPTKIPQKNTAQQGQKIKATTTVSPPQQNKK